MAKKDKGWDYLNSDDINNMSDGDEDDMTFSHSDGSSSFHGADGSWGYKNTDGSASYHGADGSWGYRNADGSASYYGADGSWGYRNADGSTSYYDADSGSEYGNSEDQSDLDEDEDSEDDEDDDLISKFARALGMALGAGLVNIVAAFSRAVGGELEREAILEAEKREKRRAWWNKHKKEIFIVLMIFVLIIFGMIGRYEFQKLVPFNYSSEELTGLKYYEVVQKLKESGFSNIHTKEISDLTISREEEENLVTEINLLLLNKFNEDTKYPSNMRIVVVYHTVELYAPPLTSSETKGMNYLDVVETFEIAGFTDIEVEVEYDIITGWLLEEGEVKSVTINGDTKFNSHNKYRLDAEIVITYHALRGSKP